MSSDTFTRQVRSEPLSPVQQEVMVQLAEIFPTKLPKVIETSVRHPSNLVEPVVVQTLITRCIDDLLEQRTEHEAFDLDDDVLVTGVDDNDVIITGHEEGTSFLLDDDEEDDVSATAKDVCMKLDPVLGLDTNWRSPESSGLVSTSQNNNRGANSAPVPSIGIKPYRLSKPVIVLKGKDLAGVKSSTSSNQNTKIPSSTVSSNCSNKFEFSLPKKVSPSTVGSSRECDKCASGSASIEGHQSSVTAGKYRPCVVNPALADRHLFSQDENKMKKISFLKSVSQPKFKLSPSKLDFLNSPRSNLFPQDQKKLRPSATTQCEIAGNGKTLQPPEVCAYTSQNVLSDLTDPVTVISGEYKTKPPAIDIKSPSYSAPDFSDSDSNDVYFNDSDDDIMLTADDDLPKISFKPSQLNRSLFSPSSSTEGAGSPTLKIDVGGKACQIKKCTAGFGHTVASGPGIPVKSEGSVPPGSLACPVQKANTVLIKPLSVTPKNGQHSSTNVNSGVLTKTQPSGPYRFHPPLSADGGPVVSVPSKESIASVTTFTVKSNHTGASKPSFVVKPSSSSVNRPGTATASIIRPSSNWKLYDRPTVTTSVSSNEVPTADKPQSSNGTNRDGIAEEIHPLRRLDGGNEIENLANVDLSPQVRIDLLYEPVVTIPPVHVPVDLVTNMPPAPVHVPVDLVTNIPPAPVHVPVDLTDVTETGKAETSVEDEVLNLFPDVDPTYLTDLCVNHTGFMAVNNICSHLLDNPSYPRRAKPSNQSSSHAVDPPIISTQQVDYYKDYKSLPIPCISTYQPQAFNLLTQEFLWLTANDIRMVMRLFDQRYAPSHQALSSIWEQGKEVARKMVSASCHKLPRYNGLTYQAQLITASGERRMNIRLLKSKRQVVRCKISVIDELQQEVDFVCQKKVMEVEEKDHQVAMEMNEKEYEDLGECIECGCCYGEYPFEKMVQCYEGHLFCENCLQQYAKESVFGQGKADLRCMTDVCDSSFPNSQLVRALPSDLLTRYEDRVTEENLNLADLGDLVRCPHCEYAAFMDPMDKVFRCQRDSCEKETCRYCKEDWSDHCGKRCDEVEKKDETKLRVTYEEKMTQAKVRMCHRCKAQFMKESGCNKMTCRCGAKMCYICRKPDIDYNHFCRHPRDPGNPCKTCTACSLWSNAEEDDNRAVSEIQKEAEMKRKNEGYLEEKVIGVPEPPPNNKKRRVL